MQGVAIISDTAGKGKSTILNRFGHLLKQQKPNTWVLRSNLNAFKSHLHDARSSGPEPSKRFMQQQMRYNKMANNPVVGPFL